MMFTAYQLHYNYYPFLIKTFRKLMLQHCASNHFNHPLTQWANPSKSKGIQLLLCLQKCTPGTSKCFLMTITEHPPGCDDLYRPVVRSQIVFPVNYTHAENRRRTLMPNSSGLRSSIQPSAAEQLESTELLLTCPK